MTIPRNYLFVITTAFAIAGCSNSGKPLESSSPSPLASTSPATSPVASPASPPAQTSSAFCLDLPTFQIGAIMFRAEVLDAAHGKRLDVAELRRKAKVLALLAKEMKASAPPEIATHFDTVVRELAASARALKSEASMREAAAPLLKVTNQVAFDAVDNFKCIGPTP
ncbi:hypothetical protein [Herbidospora sp. NBRC 101105]|uniref:hypothetical protein n=1 Tax=Herbidospora sp. NBRC 101105 TaxID=3032195 RepID=UPI0024A5086B|nr:hypothetical protein [Herbidospora sp. NBRC 101105]GLX92931.1 hypothetical protein Hesp01_08810 [Herbidospora sp. NBRC 101105]